MGEVHSFPDQHLWVVHLFIVSSLFSISETANSYPNTISYVISKWWGLWVGMLSQILTWFSPAVLPRYELTLRADSKPQGWHGKRDSESIEICANKPTHRWLEWSFSLNEGFKHTQHGRCSINGCWVTNWMESPQCCLCIPTTQPFILFHPDNFNSLLTVSLPTNPKPFTCPWLVFLFGNIFFMFCSASSYQVPWEYGLVFSFR